MNKRIKGSLKPYRDNIKSVIYTFILSASIILSTSFILYCCTLEHFLTAHYGYVIEMLKKDYKNNTILTKNYYTNTNIEITLKKKVYVLKNNVFVETKKSNFKNYFFSYSIPNLHATVYIGSHTLFDSDNGLQIKVDMKQAHNILFVILVLMSSNIVFYSIFHQYILIIKLKALQSFKLSAQEYALSERTTSYLISIMHHKLNTPLKIISTKSRVLAQIIFESNMNGEVKKKVEKDYINLHNALINIFEITNKLKSFKANSQKELNIYKLFGIAIETIEILRDDDFTIDVDRRTKLFEINKIKLSPHEMIQVFINQIKFSVEEMSTEINIKLFNSNNEKIQILFSDNGNPITDEVRELVKKKATLDSLDPEDRNEYYTDLLLNLSILENSGGSLKVLSSNENGTTYEIVIPVFKLDLKNKKGKLN